jgi:hypothetical protein
METAPTADAPRKAVAIFGEPTSPHAVAELLADVAGLSPTDALIHARYAPGVLPDRLEPSQADLLVQRLVGIGLSAETIDPASLLDFHAPHIVHHARILDAGLELFTERGAADGLIPWDRLLVISAGQVPLESTQRFDWNDEHLFATARRSHHEAHRGALPPTMELWLVDNGPKPIRIDQTRMNYETLGNDKTDSSAQNFRLFLERLTARASRAHVTPATRAFLDHGSLLKYSFASTEELQHATQLQALIARRM